MFRVIFEEMVLNWDLNDEKEVVIRGFGGRVFLVKGDYICEGLVVGI